MVTLTLERLSLVTLYILVDKLDKIGFVKKAEVIVV